MDSRGPGNPIRRARGRWRSRRKGFHQALLLAGGVVVFALGACEDTSDIVAGPDSFDPARCDYGPDGVAGEDNDPLCPSMLDGGDTTDGSDGGGTDVGDVTGGGDTAANDQAGQDTSTANPPSPSAGAAPGGAPGGNAPTNATGGGAAAPPPGATSATTKLGATATTKPATTQTPTPTTQKPAVTTQPTATTKPTPTTMKPTTTTMKPTTTTTARKVTIANSEWVLRMRPDPTSADANTGPYNVRFRVDEGTVSGGQYEPNLEADVVFSGTINPDGSTSALQATAGKNNDPTQKGTYYFDPATLRTPSSPATIDGRFRHVIGKSTYTGSFTLTKRN